MGLTNLGIFHTIIGIIAALASFIKHGKINLALLSGKIYFYGTISTSLTALGISKHGGLNPGHAFALFIVILMSVAFFLYSRKKGNNSARLIENFLLSFSLLLSLVPTVAETFQRIPIGHPLANGPGDPAIGKTLLVLLVFFILGSIYQFRIQKKINASVDK